MAITKLRIFPPVGVARVGDSGEYFIGPELPGNTQPPAGGYRDSSCRIKRQAARFRIFAYDENDQLVLDNGKPKEITAADGQISWTVELANRKSAWKEFDGPNTNTGLRNSTVGDRASLEIVPGPRTLDAPNQNAAFNTGQFLGKAVALGEMHTDAQGRCIVVGAFGHSESIPPGLPIVHYANNDGWHDDISDGPVKATVVLNGQQLDAVPAWVLCAPPDFAPPVESITTLYDTLYQAAVNQGLLLQPGNPSLTKDIYPILRRSVRLGGVSSLANGKHVLFDLANPQNIAQGTRQSVFSRLRDPDNPVGAASANMPYIKDDVDDNYGVVTKIQYAYFKKWAGQPGVDWTSDWNGPPAAAVDITPDGLTRAALDNCVGYAFYPGIEASWFMRDTYAYIEPFRLDPTGRQAGDVTKQMAVPWQSDFYACKLQNGRAWWPAQRPDDVTPESGGPVRLWTDMLVGSKAEMVDNWWKLGFVVEKNGVLVETERRVVCRGMALVTDKSSFAADEVDAVLVAQNPAPFPGSLYLITEGFLPGELGIPGPNPTPQQLQAIAPVIAFTRMDNSAVPAMSAVCDGLLMQVSPPPANLQQRFTFAYRVEFGGTGAFFVNGMPVEEQVINATATKNAVNRTFASLAHLSLFQAPNPYMLDGPVSWLSTDLRVFEVTEGDAPFNNAFGAVGADPAAALTFINDAVAGFNQAPQANHPFDTIATDQSAATLELSRSVSNKRVFNFAVARVRYRASTLDADNVRVFFRLFTTAATGMDFHLDSTYRRSTAPASPVALLGVQAGYVVTIPCFGRARVDSSATPLDMQVDDLNVRKLSHAGANEFQGYFGCWLDFNQTEPQFPRQVAANLKDGPWASGRVSIQELIRGMHQCLVAEVWFTKHPIGDGETPASSQGLAQRNLAILDSDNPGSPATHTVQHTFEIKATNPRPARSALLARHRTDGRNAAVADWFEPGPDELMIRWGSLPRDSRVTLYVPDVSAESILELAGRRMDTPRLVKVDEHTLECLPGDVTFVPLPEGRARNNAALLTIELPETIKYEQAFNAFVQQVSGFPRAVLGTFQVRVVVRHKSEMLAPAVRGLSVLRHIARSIPPDDPWHAVFLRYLAGMAARVDGFGGNSAGVAPSPDGTGVDEAERRCTATATSLVLLLAFAAMAIGIASIAWLGIVAALGALAIGAAWRKRCRPHPTVAALVVGAGLVVGVAALAIALWLGAGAPWSAIWLLACAIAAALLLVYATLRMLRQAVP